MVEFIRDRILTPLGTDQTYYNHVEAGQTGHRVEGFFRDKQDLKKGIKKWTTTKNPPEGCLEEMRSLGWMRGKGDQALDQAGWAGVVISPTGITWYFVAGSHFATRPLNIYHGFHINPALS